MLKFNRAKFLPLFLKRNMTVNELAKKAGVSHRAADRAVNSLPITAPVVNRIADALQVNPLEFFATPDTGEILEK